MQVFMSENSFEKCAQVLDTKRLVKQLLEGRQILAALAGQTKGWRNHPAAKMFEGSELTLYRYLYYIRKEMELRGFKTEKNWNEIVKLRDYFEQQGGDVLPRWLVDEYEYRRIVVTHRKSLYNKAPELYPQYKHDAYFGQDSVCCSTCNYYWPTHKKENVNV